MNTEYTVYPSPRYTRIVHGATCTLRAIIFKDNRDRRYARRELTRDAEKYILTESEPPFPPTPATAPE